MHELDDAALELRLRRVLTDRLGSLTLEVTAEGLERRRLARDSARGRRRVLIGLGLAAALVLPAGWLAAGAPLPTPPVPPVALQTPGPTEDAAPSQGLLGDGSCPAMVQLTQSYPVDPDLRLPGSPPSRTLGRHDLLITTAAPDGRTVIARLDLSSGVAMAVDQASYPDRVFPSLVEVDPLSQLSASPDGRAIAVEAGDLGPNGCGDPVVILADGGRVRPFPAGLHTLVSGLAWAPDGSALYAVRRSTSQEFVDADGSGWHVDGPGTVLRWDTASGAVTDLGDSCGTCSDPSVSPDGSRIAVSDGQAIWLYESASGWRRLVSIDAGLDPAAAAMWRALSRRGPEILGWADAGSVVLADRRVVGLDGTFLKSWAQPCCHGTEFNGSLSPDHTTMAGVSLSRDFLSWDVNLLDLRDGSVRSIWTAADPNGCAVFGQGSTGRTECEAQGHPTPGPMAIAWWSKVATWAPDGRSVVVLDQDQDGPTARLIVVPVDGPAPTSAPTLSGPDDSGSGRRNLGPSVLWLP